MEFCSLVSTSRLEWLPAPKVLSLSAHKPHPSLSKKIRFWDKAVQNLHRTPQTVFYHLSSTETYLPQSANPPPKAIFALPCMPAVTKTI